MVERRKREWRRVVAEAGGVVALGFVLGLLANALSPRGLSLTRDYFPSASVAPARTGIAAPSTAAPSAGEAALPVTNRVAARLEAKGLRSIDHPEVVSLFGDPRHAQELILFIDARDDRHYQEGHIPGAYQFDHYYPQNYLPTVVPACHQAERIIVYCNGGDCEDSEFAALMLTGNGIPPDRLAIYVGGWTQWSTNGLPVELGQRGSGQRPQDQP
jgi:rhodanese-related sulfurtransferase